MTWNHLEKEPKSLLELFPGFQVPVPPLHLKYSSDKFLISYKPRKSFWTLPRNLKKVLCVLAQYMILRIFFRTYQIAYWWFIPPDHFLHTVAEYMFIRLYNVYIKWFTILGRTGLRLLQTQFARKYAQIQGALPYHLSYW